MSVPLLATKFYFPPGRQNFVSRSRLIERLQQGLQCPLTLVSAPAGYGKTTLMSEWRAGVGRSIPAAWLSLDTNDDDPAHFLTCLIGALETLKPGQCEAARALLQSPQPPSGQSILTVLLNELGQSDQPSVLVLDDYHFVTAQPRAAGSRGAHLHPRAPAATDAFGSPHPHRPAFAAGPLARPQPAR